MARPEIQLWTISTPEGVVTYEQHITRNAAGDVMVRHRKNVRRDGRSINDSDLESIIARFGEGRRR